MNRCRERNERKGDPRRARRGPLHSAPGEREADQLDEGNIAREPDDNRQPRLVRIAGRRARHV